MWKRFRAGRKATENSSFSTANVTEDEQIHISTQSSQTALPLLLRREAEQTETLDARGAVLEPHREQTDQRQDSRDKSPDPLGFLVLHAPPNRSVDIVFIHGLGGTSRGTWCRHRDYDTLWPQSWLPLEEGLTSARVLTFGYNANFSTKKQRTSLTIGDFARDLLFQMKYGENGDDRLGQVPIIVVAHSMGGLVFKKAFISGHLNDEFRDIMSMVKAVLFLSTPHRGADLASTLNMILTTSLFGHSSKEYVSELARRSPTIDELNDTFRQHATKLKIFSFYETLATTIGPISTMILDKHSAVLGYPNETPQPLVANHRTVCKFADANDPNYLSIIAALRSIVKSCQLSAETHSGVEDQLKLIKALLGQAGAPEDDLIATHVSRGQGIGDHFIQSPEVQMWQSSEPHGILWANGPPGSGKSTLCALAIERLRESGHVCAFFFFRHGHHQKRLLSNMLRSLAYQMAEQLPSVRQALADFAREGLQLQGSDTITVWKQLYLSIIASIDINEDVYWVIDGLDESESSKLAANFICTANKFNCKIRILAFSRPDPAISRAMTSAKQNCLVWEVPILGNENDIRLVVSDKLEYMPCDEDFRAWLIDEITTRSQGNFLWLNLVLERVVTCHRQGQVRGVIENCPDGMGQLYDRMLDSVATLELKEDQTLARTMLSWAMYAKTPITIDELFEPYETQLRPIMDFRHTVDQVCGQFVVITAQGEVTLVHHSARQYLQKSTRQPFPLHSEASNEELLGKCLVALCSRNLRTQLNVLKIPHFLTYAATSWAFHLGACSVASNRILNGLVRFFSGPFPLSWIQYLAMSGHLSELVVCSRQLSVFLKKRRDLVSDRVSDLAILESWAIDLMKIPTKFGSHLSDDPSLIYNCIPSLSPSTSAISQQFSAASRASLSVLGVSNDQWDDCLARISAESGRALRLASSSLHLAVASDAPKGTITLWEVDSFQEKWTFNIGQRITALTFSNSGAQLACCGISKTCLWNVKDGTQELQITNPPRERAIEFRFAADGSLLMVTETRRVFRLPRPPDARGMLNWIQLDSALLEETNLPEDMWLGTPTAVSFNDECTQMAVAYRAAPLTIWSLDPPQVVARLKRKPRKGEDSINSYTGDNKVVWHPSGSAVLGLYGRIIRWHISDDTCETVQVKIGAIPHQIQCSPSGLVFITGNVEGAIKIYDFASMALIYQLNSDEPVGRICFSPDSVRFYDLRRSYCNVWEPDCLMLLADASLEQFSGGDSPEDSFWSSSEEINNTSISITASETHADHKPSIVCLGAGSKHQQLVAYADYNGSIEVYDPETGTKHTLATPIFGGGIDCIAWDRKHTQLAYSRWGTVIVKGVRADTSVMEQNLAVADIYSEKPGQMMRGNTRQLIFDESGERLLVCGTKSCQVVSLLSSKAEAECPVNEADASCWLQHPSMPDRLMSFTTTETCTYTWKLERLRELRVQPPYPRETSATTALHAVLTSYCSHILLFRTITLNLGRPQYGFALFSLSDLPATELCDTGDFSEDRQDLIRPLSLPKFVKDRVVHPLGILPDGRFVFLDKKLRACTSQVQASGGLNQHFFIPQDWVTSEELRSCQTFCDGTVLLPTKGGVAIIHSDISDWPYNT
ncbi:Fc.00g074250.m01.CDS01 [Cosmosporella sp. VM-42]